MGMMDKFKEIMGVPAEEEEYDEEIGEEEEVVEDDFIRPRAAAAIAAESPRGTDTVTTRNKIVNINATTQLQVVLVKPINFEDASTVADHLNAKRTVVLNLESTNKDVSRRLVDFLSGVAYANNGQIKRVAASTFIITPYNVDIVGDLLDELESNGVYF